MKVPVDDIDAWLPKRQRSEGNSLPTCEKKINYFFSMLKFHEAAGMLSKLFHVHTVQMFSFNIWVRPNFWESTRNFYYIGCTNFLQPPSSGVDLNIKSQSH